MDYYDITIKLIGPIQPIGSEHIDTKRLENLKEMIELVDGLLGDLIMVSESADRHEASMKKAGKLAKEFLKECREG